jgi:hypothetical protein
MSINLAKQVQTTEIKFEGPLANNYGGKYAKVKYQGRWLLVQTPKMLAPYGMSIYEDKDNKGNPTGKKTYSLDVSFNGYEPAEDSNSDEPRRPSVRQFYDLVTDMENNLVDHAHQNNFTWVDNPDASREVCKALLRTSVKWSRDKDTKQIIKKYAPKVKLNLPVYEDGMGFKAFVNDKSNEIKNVEDLEKALSGRCDVVAIIKCDKVTFNGGKYGYKWTVAQLKIYSSQSALATYAFIEDSDQEEETKESKSSSSTQHEHVNVVDDSEEEEDELDGEVSSEEEEEEVSKPPTPPTKKKKVVRRRKKKNDA